MFLLKRFDVFFMLLLLLAMVDMAFCKDFLDQDFPHFYLQVKQGR